MYLPIYLLVGDTGISNPDTGKKEIYPHPPGPTESKLSYMYPSTSQDPTRRISTNGEISGITAVSPDFCCKIRDPFIVPRQSSRKLDIKYM